MGTWLQFGISISKITKTSIFYKGESGGGFELDVLFLTALNALTWHRGLATTTRYTPVAQVLDPVLLFS
jgi:hypothetical protein